MARRSEPQTFAFNLENLPTNQAMEPLSHIYANWLHCLAKMNGEMSQFVSHRLKQDFEIPSKLANCHDAGELYETQLAFMQQMATDYSQEAQRMMGLVAKVTDEQHNARHDKT